MTMTYEVKSVSQELLAVIQDRLGRYNDFPPNMTEITEEQFLAEAVFGIYSPVYLDYRQAYPKTADGVKDVHQMYTTLRMYIWSDFNGVLASEKSLGYVKGKDGPQYERKFYRFKYCEHQMVGVPEKSRNCYSVSRCTKCDYVNAVDSSD
jgi:hypothetical protein